MNLALIWYMRGDFPNDGTHCRDIGLGVKTYQYFPWAAEMFRILRPGGWVQLIVIKTPLCEDGSLPQDSYYCEVASR